MSESSPAGVVGNALGGGQQTLTPEKIEAVLADFRAWLMETGASTFPAAQPQPHVVEPVDLHTLLGQFLALRHEVNLQTKAVRSQQEQNAETLRQLAQAVASFQGARAGADEDGRKATDELLRPLLKTLVDMVDALTVAAREVRRVTDTVLPDLEQLPLPPATAAPKVSFWGKLLRRGAQAAEIPARIDEQPSQNVARIRAMLGSLMTGYTMSLQRAERALTQHELERIDCVGEMFDPEEMEVVEAVGGSGRPPGEVLEEVRCGYLWRGRVFRYAQVRVAKDSV